MLSFFSGFGVGILVGVVLAVLVLLWIIHGVGETLPAPGEEWRE